MKTFYIHSNMCVYSSFYFRSHFINFVLPLAGTHVDAHMKHLVRSRALSSLPYFAKVCHRVMD